MMTRKTIILFLILLVLFVSTSGCNNKIEAPSESSIPFLTFSVNQKAGYVEAYLNYWDIANGKILQTNKVLYIVKAQPNRTDKPGVWDWSMPVHYFGPPLSWDGESYIYLSSQYHNVKNSFNFKITMFDDPIDSAKFASGKVIKDYDLFNYSQNLQVQMKNVGGINYLKEKYSDFTYRVFDNNGKKLIEKEIKISLYNDVFHGGVDIGEACLYEKDKNEVKQLLLYYDSVGMGHFLICTINLEKGTYEWNEVTGLKGCIPYMNQSEVSIIEGKFYVPLCGCYIGVINPDDYTCKLFDQQEIFKSLSFYNAPIYCGGYPAIPGEYKDFLILNGTVDYGEKTKDETLSENYRHLWIAFNTKTNEIASILEWSSLEPKFIVVRDRNGKELSKVETDKLIKNISKLYNVNGESYIKGFFIFENFVRFPHKNGG
ncbi:hypothetical protein [Caldisericum exile]|uniref:Uncharacterized protein n=1 Tax=Caldisericum exile (strain DSM 21853 / NBRC 104410 / AZM16c01) TaxID=511051 RepID=A0A7U6JF66_CALEA|nr:hypothetical protein [Caldisericum exile]BAL80278.1 hypothetical protein CSE_01520 [Caldisericum exile AZM16c01]BAL81153.1 hypothetical protein CSE_10270 [Caldisericum exile AZM16c01]